MRQLSDYITDSKTGAVLLGVTANLNGIIRDNIEPHGSIDIH